VEANESLDNVFKFFLPDLFEPGSGRTKSVGIYDSGRFDVTPRCQISFADALKIHQFHSVHSFLTLPRMPAFHKTNFRSINTQGLRGDEYLYEKKTNDEYVSRKVICISLYLYSNKHVRDSVLPPRESCSCLICLCYLPTATATTPHGARTETPRALTPTDPTIIVTHELQ
jgi:hypothetical protein